MKRNVLVSALLLGMACANGCLVVHTETRGPARATEVEPEDATIREIDAIGNLAFDDDRKRGYKRIAERDELGDGAQVYLIEAVFKRLAFEDAKVDVLLALVGNPSFGRAAEAALLDRLDRLAFESNKNKILDAINERKM